MFWDPLKYTLTSESIRARPERRAQLRCARYTTCVLCVLRFEPSTATLRLCVLRFEGTPSKRQWELTRWGESANRV